MATYPYQGQFGQGTSNPQWGGGKNMATARFQTTPLTAVPAGVTPNPWMRELSTVLSGFGFNPKTMSMSGGKANAGYGSLSPEVMAWIKASLGPGGAGAGGLTQTAVTPTAPVDTSAAIRAALPGIQEQQTKSFGEAAKRFGQTGMLASQPYMEALGNVSRKSSNDIASLIENLVYQAGEQYANRQLQAGEGYAGRQLQASEGYQNRLASANEANKGRMFDAANLAFQNWQGNRENGNADQLALMQLLGDWYMRMREGDENRTLSYAGMNQGGGTGGGSGRAPSYIPAENTGASRMSSYAQQLQERDLRRQLTGANESGTTRAATSQTDPLADIRRQLEMQELTRQLNQQPTEEEQMATNLRKKQLAYDLENGPWAAAKGSAATGGPSNELFRWLNGMGFDQSMIDAIKMNPQMLEFFWSKFNQRGA